MFWMGSINYSGQLRKMRSRLFLRADVGSFDGYHLAPGELPEWEIYQHHGFEYANRDELIQSIELYTQKLRDDDHAEESELRQKNKQYFNIRYHS